MRLWKQLLAVLLRAGFVGLVIAFLAGIVAAAYFASVFPEWTGFGPPSLDAQGHELPHAKTLWDWLQLLLVPMVLAVGGYLLTRSENRYALKLQERREEEGRKLEEQRVQDAALQAYLDQMTQLLLHEKLRTSEGDDEVRSVARARTLTVLRVLDGARKATVVQFLYEADLIGRRTLSDNKIYAVVSLSGADLTRSSLGRARLRGVNLEEADLREADLDGADLFKAELNGANLTGARLRGANLEEAALGQADLREADLDRAYLHRAHLWEVDLDGANLHGVDLGGANLQGARLLHAHLPHAHLGGANLEEADLRGVNLRETRMHGAKLTGAKLTGAYLREANLEEADLHGVNLGGATISRELTITERAAQDRSRVTHNLKPISNDADVPEDRQAGDA